MRSRKVPPDSIRDVLSYDPETGKFVWLVAVGKRSVVGSEAGSIMGGYVVIKYLGEPYLAHRLAWFLEKGSEPPTSIDHINGQKEDNRISNLREATFSQNMANTGIWRHNTSGYRGVSKQRRGGKWMSTIRFHRKRYHLGVFETAEAASAAYEAKAAQLFGEFYRSLEAMK